MLLLCMVYDKVNSKVHGHAIHGVAVLSSGACIFWDAMKATAHKNTQKVPETHELHRVSV